MMTRSTRQLSVAKSWLKRWYAASLVLIGAYAGAVTAHEFWIEPEVFEIASGSPLRAYVRVGQNLKGDSLPLFRQAFERFEIHAGEHPIPLASRIGDDPIVNQAFEHDGLVILSCVSTDSLLRYEEAQKFLSFLDYEGIQWVAEAHKRRGLPPFGFSEAYQRFAKSLVRVGSGDAGDVDRVLGLRFELVLTSDPYSDPGRGLAGQLLWQAKPMADTQVSLFRRAADRVERQLLRTDANGRFSLEGALLPGVYLLNAVHMEEAAADRDDGAVWKSFWASTTFAVDASNR
ncbi:MAG: DUF4198 domain-containing protein [Gammaproteobacteria bacterium]|nr:DUF4198 domain-containing protein [Gammaproteobacteria bacterium]